MGNRTAPADRSREAQLLEMGLRRVLVEKVAPAVDCGRHPAKRTVGDRVVVEADLVADGHEKVAGAVLYRPRGEPTWREAPLEPLPNDRWRGAFVPDRIGRWEYTVEAWVDTFATWRDGLHKKADAGQDVHLELLEGAELVHRAAERTSGEDAEALSEVARALSDEEVDAAVRVEVALDAALAARMHHNPDRTDATRHDPPLALVVDPVRARFSAWYELFPRSSGPNGAHGTLADAAELIPYVAEMGFDVLYLPPIHPIGRTHRKGPNNTLGAGPDDVGCPWAIGAAEGGHKAVHPELGTLDDFRRFVRRANEAGLEVAIDIAFQASPDHPWVKEHPEWFRRRPDGTIQYAENPPKKYQDVYPFDFDSKDWRGLWEELLSVFLFWIDQGVRTFRVDNPHTKSLRFWEWCIDRIKSEHPDVVFLSEAFTRPKLMYALAKLGFTQSYTYFTWRTTRHELAEYLAELTRTEAREFFRPNFWPNTPDILPEHLQHGGRGAFLSRLVLASTLSSSWGMYGPAFELMERVPRPGAEEYVDNEKYQLRDWDLEADHSLRHVVARINRIRRDRPALQHTDNVRFHATDNDELICYSKQWEDDLVLVVVNLDPHHRHSGWVELDLRSLGVDPEHPYLLHDLLGDARYVWHGPRNFVELDPHVMPAHVFEVRRRTRTEVDFDYFE